MPITKFVVRVGSLFLNNTRGLSAEYPESKIFTRKVVMDAENVRVPESEICRIVNDAAIRNRNHHGFTNHETFLVSMRMHNCGLTTQQGWLNIARTFVIPRQHYASKCVNDVAGLSASLERQFDMTAERWFAPHVEGDNGCMYTGLIGAAFNRINWEELAEELLRKLQEGC